MHFLYFAYGSNMLALRLQKRCPSAVLVETATAKGYGVNFSKLGRDSSGKGALFREQNSTALGVVFKVAHSDLEKLDEAEGVWHGYDRDNDFEVVIQSGQALRTTTYVPPQVDIRLKPYAWYLALVIAGAIENDLPEYYIEKLKKSPYQADEIPSRPSRLDAIATLESTGHSNWRELFKVANAPEQG